MIGRLLRKGVDLADDLVVAADRRAGREGVLVGVFFHALCETPAQLGRSPLAANLVVPVDVFSAFIEQMLEDGFTPVSPVQIDAGLAPGGRYLAITFDDGYFNNVLATEVLDRFRVPATFFVSTGHVQHGKAFWWDSLSRELSRRGASSAMQQAETERLKTWTPDKIDDFLCQSFGPSVLQPSNDLDRPFSPGELAQFAANPRVHVGNHTRDHAILTNCTPEEQLEQLQGCQEALAAMVGYQPLAIAYPNGNYSPAVVEAASTAGLRVGFTTKPQRCPLPVAADKRLTIGRYFFDAGQDVRRQCRMFGARFVPSHALKSLLHSAG